MRHATELGETRDDLLHARVVIYIYIVHRYMGYCIKGCHRIQRASVADNHRYLFILQSPLPPQSVYLTIKFIDNKVQLTDCVSPDVLERLCNNKRIITGAKPIPYAITMGVDVDSMNVSDHVEFDAPQTSYLGDTIAKRILEGIPLTRGRTDHDLPSLQELMQISMEPFDSQSTGEATSPNEDYLYEPTDNFAAADMPFSIASRSSYVSTSHMLT